MQSGYEGKTPVLHRELTGGEVTERRCKLTPRTQLEPRHEFPTVEWRNCCENRQPFANFAFLLCQLGPLHLNFPLLLNFFIALYGHYDLHGTVLTFSIVYNCGGECNITLNLQNCSFEKNEFKEYYGIKYINRTILIFIYCKICIAFALWTFTRS